jgi:hypothetical protein
MARLQTATQQLLQNFTDSIRQHHTLTQEPGHVSGSLPAINPTNAERVG